MAKIGSLSVVLSLASARFEAGMKRAKAGVVGFRGAIGRVGGAMSSFGRAMRAPIMAMGVFGGAASIMIKRSLASIDATSKFSQTIGLAIGKLRGLELGAKLAGVEVRQLHLGLQRMVRRVAEAATGTGEAKAALKEMGIDAKRLVQLSIDEQFMAIAEAMEAVENQADRVRLGMRLFDTRGVALIRIMKGGASAIQEVFDQSEKYGNSLRAIDAARVEAVNDAFTRTSTAISGLRDQLTIGLTGTLAALAETLEAWAVRAVGNIDSINAAVQRGIGAGVRTGGGVLGLLTGAGRGVKGGVQLLGAGASAMAHVPAEFAHQIGATSSAIRDATANLTMAFWDDAVKNMSAAWKSNWDILSGTRGERITQFMHEADIRFQGAAAERAKSLPATAGMPSTDFGAMLQELKLMRQGIENLGAMPG